MKQYSVFAMFVLFACIFVTCGGCTVGTIEYGDPQPSVMDGNDGQADQDGDSGSWSPPVDAGSKPEEEKPPVETTSSPRLGISLASWPSSGVLVKKSFQKAVVGLTLTANQKMIVKSIALSAQVAMPSEGCAFGDTPCAPGNTDKRLTSAAFFDGDKQVGWGMSANKGTGVIAVPNVDLSLQKGESKTLVVKISLSSTASAEEPYDQIAIGIAKPSHVVVCDEQDNPVAVILDGGVVDQSYGVNPKVTQVIRPHGALSIKAEHPQSDNKVGGTDAWEVFARYHLSAEYEEMGLDLFRVAPQSFGYKYSNADYVALAVAVDGLVRGVGILPSEYKGQAIDIFESQSPVYIPAGTSADVEIWAKMRAPQPTLYGGKDALDMPRSGHASGLGFTKGITVGEWSEEYAGAYNIRTTGQTTGERIYLSSVAVQDQPNPMVLRKSVPTLAKQQLASNKLKNAVGVELYKVQITSDPVGSVSIKQLTYFIDKGQGFVLSDFRLRKGSSLLPVADYAVTFSGLPPKEVVKDVKFGQINADESDGHLVVSFTSEDVVAAQQGSVYTLVATVSGAELGDELNARLTIQPGNSVTTGCLKNNLVLGLTQDLNERIFFIDVNIKPGYDYPVWAAGFVWSDNSETPHNPFIESQGGSSCDWINDLHMDIVAEEKLTY